MLFPPSLYCLLYWKTGLLVTLISSYIVLNYGLGVRFSDTEVCDNKLVQCGSNATDSYTLSFFFFKCYPQAIIVFF